jgi:Rrf2 family iron-sulfur cluster assembly transcriptional regulator
MKLSTKGRYGLRAVIDLAMNCEDKSGTASIQSIAQRQGISENYLEQLMRLLKKAGIIDSVRGAGGGYKLAREASKISVGDVLRALEGDLKPVDCQAISESGGCEGSDGCVTKLVWKKLNDAIQGAVDSIMLDELINVSHKRNDVCSDSGLVCEEKAGIKA